MEVSFGNVIAIAGIFTTVILGLIGLLLRLVYKWWNDRIGTIEANIANKQNGEYAELKKTVANLEKSHKNMRISYSLRFRNLNAKIDTFIKECQKDGEARRQGRKRTRVDDKSI